jgi:DNA-binding MarR family transcriptional regulator
MRAYARKCYRATVPAADLADRADPPDDADRADPPDPPQSFAAWRALLLAHHACVRAIETDLDAARLLPLTWYDVLLELRSAPDGLRMQELGQRVVLSRTRVSRLVDELEQGGLVTRRPDPADGRATIATITTAGEDAFRATAPVYLAKIDEHFNAHLSARERAVIAKALQRVADAEAAEPRSVRVSRAGARARG